MAEQELKQLLGQCLESAATIGPRTVTGVFRDGPIETLALEHLRRADAGKYSRDKLTKDVGYWAQRLREGDQITFRATVVEHGKRLHDSRLWSEERSDFTLNRPRIGSGSRRE